MQSALILHVREGRFDITLDALLQILRVTVERGSKFIIFYILGKITKSFGV